MNLRHGLISGTDTAITGTGDANVVNKGTISAPVAIDAPVVSLENHGKITGDIDASQVLQAQFFSGTVFKGEIEPGDFGAYITIYGGARLDSPLSGLDGNTSYTLIGKTSAVIDENENGGLDRVITTMKNYVLPDNVEDLDMGNGLYQNSPLPKSGHGIGDSLDNILAGEKNDILEGHAGNDILMHYDGSQAPSVCTFIGGAGDDTFVTYVHRGGTWKNQWDVVEDFVKGKDKIAYLEDHRVSFSGLDITQHDDDTWIGFNHRDLILKDVDASTLTSDDFQFSYENPFHFY